MPDRPIDWHWGVGVDPDKRVLNGGRYNRDLEPIRLVTSSPVSRRFVDIIERDTKRGPMVLSVSGFRWENQAGGLARLGEHTAIY